MGDNKLFLMVKLFYTSDQHMVGKVGLFVYPCNTSDQPMEGKVYVYQCFFGSKNPSFLISSIEIKAYLCFNMIFTTVINNFKNGGYIVSGFCFFFKFWKIGLHYILWFDWTCFHNTLLPLYTCVYFFFDPSFILHAYQ